MRGLFRGIAAPMVCIILYDIFSCVLMDPGTQAGCALLNGIVFASYGLLMRAQLNHSNDIPNLRQIALAGAGSGILASYVFSMSFHRPPSHLNFLESYLVPQSFSRLNNRTLRHCHLICPCQPQANSLGKSGASKDYLAFTEGLRRLHYEIQATVFTSAWSVIYRPKWRHRLKIVAVRVCHPVISAA